MENENIEKWKKEFEKSERGQAIDKDSWTYEISESSYVYAHQKAQVEIDSLKAQNKYYELFQQCKLERDEIKAENEKKEAHIRLCHDKIMNRSTATTKEVAELEQQNQALKQLVEDAEPYFLNASHEHNAAERERLEWLEKKKEVMK